MYLNRLKCMLSLTNHVNLNITLLQKPFKYVDDMALLTVDSNPNKVENNLQHDLTDWFAINKLSINCMKTKSLIFTSQQDGIPWSNPG